MDHAFVLLNAIRPFPSDGHGFLLAVPSLFLAVLSLMSILSDASSITHSSITSPAGRNICFLIVVMIAGDRSGFV